MIRSLVLSHRGLTHISFVCLALSKETDICLCHPTISHSRLLITPTKGSVCRIISQLYNHNHIKTVDDCSLMGRLCTPINTMHKPIVIPPIHHVPSACVGACLHVSCVNVYPGCVMPHLYYSTHF